MWVCMEARDRKRWELMKPRTRKGWPEIRALDLEIPNYKQVLAGLSSLDEFQMLADDGVLVDSGE